VTCHLEIVDNGSLEFGVNFILGAQSTICPNIGSGKSEAWLVLKHEFSNKIVFSSTSSKGR
jgi:hypothetical protein